MVQKAKERFLFERVASALLKDLKSAAFQEVPSIGTLCARYGASTVTVRKALSVLEQQDVLRVYPGRKMVLPPESAGGQTRTLSAKGSAHTLYEKIRAQVVEGQLRYGEYLPKVAYHTISEKVTTRTVVDAYRMLEDNGLAHKEGKTWVVGPAKPVKGPRRSDSGGPQPPTVLVLIADFDNWRDASLLWPVYPLVNQATAELDACGFNYQVACTQKTVSYGVLSGRRQVLDFVIALGTSFRGVFIADTLESIGEETFRSWVKWLAQFKQPIVWYDRTFGMRRCDRKDLPIAGYYRCFCSEEALASLALTTLREHGHTHVALFDDVRWRSDLWVGLRIKAIQEAASAVSPAMHVEVIRQEKDMREVEPGSLTESVISRYIDPLREKVGKSNPGMSAQRQQHLLQQQLGKAVPAFAKLLAHKEITALVALNDVLACWYLVWLQEMGISVPRDLSVLSFDNAPATRHYQITTIDLRLEQLGYMAGHVFAGDLPIKADRWGNVRNRPALVNRRTLGRPSKR